MIYVLSCGENGASERSNGSKWSVLQGALMKCDWRSMANDFIFLSHIFGDNAYIYLNVCADIKVSGSNWRAIYLGFIPANLWLLSCS